MKFFKQSLLVIAAMLMACFSAEAKPGWPANYQGVMLQGFYWDSFKDTNWANLESQADELSQYFTLIWVPNSGRAASNPGMGYDPVYWFTNHNSSFGTEAQLRSMIKTFKEKGTGIIEDVVINHRSGATNWTDFPAEKWNGQTWKIGTDGICSTDEVANAPGQAKPTGAPDTGEDFNGSRDLDHTNANVQNNCKAYCKFLLEDMGYAGFRYDMVKGYGGQYTKIYNEYSQPEFSVGEYWDGSYDAVMGWIEATGKTSAAFDFPCKYQINKAFADNNMGELVWKANGTTDQPAGMIHFGYPQYAVTFVDNHDTYRDGSKFTSSKVVAANAFILFSPGTPCVFLPHWKQYKAELKKLIALRNAVGIHNMSKVNVLKSASNCYMAEITGTKGKAVVKIGPSMDSPSGYTDSDIKASGDNYCVWSKVNGGGDDPTPQPTVPDQLYLLGNLEGAAGWADTPGEGIAMTKSGTTFTVKGAKFVLASATETKCYFNLTDFVASTWDDLNIDANRYGASTEGEAITLGTASTITPYLKDVDASGCKSWTIAPGTYDITADFATMKLTVVNSGDEPIPAKPVVSANPASGTRFETSVTVSLSVSPEAAIYYTLDGAVPTASSSKYTAPIALSETTTIKTLAVTADGVESNVQAFTYTKKQGGDDPTTLTIYYDNSVTSWSKVLCYSFANDAANGAAWPGSGMTKVEGNIWKTTVPAGSSVVFNNGSGTQTVDVVGVENNHVYKGSNEAGNAKGHKKCTDEGVYQGGDDPTPIPGESWYFVGSMTGWGLDKSLKFTQNGNVYTLTLPNGIKDPAGTTADNKGWKIWDGSWDSKNFGAGDETSAPSGVEIDAWYWGGNNFTYETEGETTIVFTLVPGSDVADSTIPSKIKVIYNGGDDPQPEVPATFGVLSTPWGGTTADEIVVTAMTRAENVWSIENYTVGAVPASVGEAPSTDGYVQFAVNTEATTWPDLSASDRYGAAVEGTAITFSGLYATNAVKRFTNDAADEADMSGACNAFKIAPGTYDFKVTFNADKTITLDSKMHASGVENVGIDADDEAAAEYFNLQGVRVENPSNGVYIRRANGKVSKVFVK